MKSKDIRIVTIIALVVLIGIPFWIWAVINWSIIDVTGANEIGDALGGITSPVIGLVGAVLVYF